MNSSPLKGSKLKQHYAIKPWRLDSLSSSNNSVNKSPQKRSKVTPKPYRQPVEECNVVDDKTPVKNVD
jgi:hypothetical protein